MDVMVYRALAPGSKTRTKTPKEAGVRGVLISSAVIDIITDRPVDPTLVNKGLKSEELPYIFLGFLGFYIKKGILRVIHRGCKESRNSHVSKPLRAAKAL